MAAITSANVANAIVKLVAADALPALVGNLVLGNLVNRDYEPMLAQAGDTVNVPLPPTGVVANDLTEGGSVQTQANNLGNAQIVLNKHKESSFVIPDVTKCLAVPDLLKIYMQTAIIAMAEALEADLFALYPGMTANTPVGVGGTAITEAVIDSAETALFKAKVPQGDSKFLIVDPTTYQSMRNISRFSEFQTAGAAGINALIQGEVAKVKNFNVIRSQYVPQTGSGTVTTHNIAFVRNAMALAMRRLPQPLPGTGAIAEYAEFGNFGFRVTMSYNPNTLAQQFTIDALYGVAILRNNHGIEVRS